MLTNTFVVQPDIFLAYPINRAFVEARAKHPPLLDFWAGSIFVLLGSLAIIAYAIYNALDIVLVTALPPLLFGVFLLVSAAFVLFVTIRLRNGRLIEGRVAVANIRPHHSRPNVKTEGILIEYCDPEGHKQVVLHTRTHHDNRPLPEVGTQAAVLYASPNMRRVL